MSDRLSEWSQTDAGIHAGIHSSVLVISYLSRAISRSKLKRATVEIGSKAGLSKSESEFFARYQYELLRDALIGTGQLDPANVPDVDQGWGLP